MLSTTEGHPNQSSRRRRRPSSLSSSVAMVPTMTAAALLVGILLSASSSMVPFHDRSNKSFVAASAVASSSSVRRRPQPQQKQQFLAASASEKKTAVVRPDYDLPKARGKKTPAHPWPVPSKQQAAAVDYSASQRQADAMQQSTEENASRVDVEETNGDLSFEEWLQLFQQAPSREVASRQQQQYQSTMGETSSDTMSYDEWLQQQQQNTQQTQQQKMGKQSAHVASMMLPPNSSSDTFSPPKDLDVMSERKRIILRPLATATGDDSSVGSAASATLPPSDGVYYYDPAALTLSQSSLSSSSSSNIEYDTNDNSKTNNNNTPELTLPETVYDEFGTPHDINDVHNEGRNEVYLEIKPHAAATSIVWGDGISSGRGKDFIGGVLSGSRWNTNQNNKPSSSSMSSSLTSSSIYYSSQDQLIVFFTVATMAIMIGILSARRLRNRNMLVDCMHPDMDDDDDDDELHLDTNSFSAGVTRAFGGVRYDKKYDVDTGQSVTGASSTGGTSALFDAASDDFGSLMGVGGSRSSNRRKGFSSYGTNDVDVGIGNGGGGLHWRGDMEKFDV